MYKVVLIHEAMPGKLLDMRAWYEQQDEHRRQGSPGYPAPKRYTTIFGQVHQVIHEVVTEKVEDWMWNRGWLSGYATLPIEGSQAEYLSYLVPGRSELRLLKELDLGASPSTVSAQDVSEYKVVLTHEVLPGKLSEMQAWFKEQDEIRKGQNAEYVPPKRYITIFGSVHQVVIEIEGDRVPSSMLERGYAEHPAEGAQAHFLQWIVPGRSELRLLKKLVAQVDRVY